MADNAEDADGLIVALMSMGFEITDCQDAIKFGKTSVESAVEWLVAGKPGIREGAAPPVQARPSLRLRPEGSAFNPSADTGPYVKPSPIQPEAAGAASQSDIPNIGQSERATDVDQSDVSIVSRLHLNNEQRRYKDEFERKQRDEAKKQAVFNKRTQKEAHARALKEIAEDREKKKLMQHTTIQTGSSTSPEKSATSPAKQSESQSTSSESGCLLQIRLPNGRSIRQSFASTATLGDVWDVTANHHSNMTGFTFIQPFPHHEFSDEEMRQSLSDLKLTPSGSLVLQKKQVTQAMEVDPAPTATISPQAPGPVSQPPASQGHDPSHSWGHGSSLELGSGGTDMDVGPPPPAVPPPPPPPSHVHAPNPSHSWGLGSTLDGDSAGSGEADMAAVAAGHLPIHDDIADDEHGDDDDEAGGFPMFGPPGNLPLGNIPMGMPFGGQPMGAGAVGGGVHGVFDMHGGGAFPQEAFGGVGQRLAPEGNPASNDAHLHRTVRDLTFERAQARIVHPNIDQHEPPPDPRPRLTHPTPTVIPTLLLACLKHITHRLNDPRNKLPSLSGIPESIAQVILQHLLKERQLKPRTLTAFIPCYLRKLILDCYPYATNELLAAVRLHTNISYLSLNACPLITDQGLQCLSSLKRLKKLNLGCCQQVTNKCVPMLCKFPNLVTLSLEGTGVTDVGVKDYLATCPQHLQQLNLNRTAVTHALISTLQSCPALRHLSLEDTKVVSLSGIQQLDKLETLNVARTGIVTESLSCLVGHPSLTSLNIGSTENMTGDDGLAQLQGLHLQHIMLPSRYTTTNRGMPFLTGFPLVALDLTNYIYVGDEGIEHIGKITSLKRLLLSNTKLTDAGMAYLSDLTHLEELNIDRTAVTNDGAHVLHGLTNLLDLSLASTSITSRLLLTGSLNACINLTKLNLSKTLVTNKGVKCLCLPSLELLSLDSTKVTADIQLALSTTCPRLSQVSLRSLEPYTREDDDYEMDESS